MKSPLIVVGPQVPVGSSDALVYLLDIYPSICELVGADIPLDLDGKSFVPVIRGQSTGVRQSLFTAYREVQRAVRDERWKLIRYPQINKTQLFDLRDDPDELGNLANDPNQAPRVERMLKLIEDWQRKLGDTTPLTSAAPRDATFIPPVE